LFAENSNFHRDGPADVAKFLRIARKTMSAMVRVAPAPNMKPRREGMEDDGLSRSRQKYPRNAGARILVVSFAL
jgi:hypothetical protein